MQDPFPLYHAGRRYPRTRWTSRKSASIVFVLCLLLALLMLGCADTGVSQQVSGQQTIVTPQPTRTSQPLLAVATFVAHRLTGTNQPPPTEVALLSPTETPVIPTNVPTSAPAPTRVPATLALRPQPNLAVAPEPTEPRLAVASPSEAAACPTGVCVTSSSCPPRPNAGSPSRLPPALKIRPAAKKHSTWSFSSLKQIPKRGLANRTRRACDTGGYERSNDLTCCSDRSGSLYSIVCACRGTPYRKRKARVCEYRRRPISTSFDVCP